MKRLVYLLIMVLSTLLAVTGCLSGASTDTTVSSRPSEGTLPPSISYFPVAMDKFAGEAYPAALATGVLALEQGCLRLKYASSTIQGQLIIWPAGFSVREENGTIEVLDKEGIPAVRVGDAVALDGGQLTAESVEKYTGNPVPPNCTGPYWLTGSVKYISLDTPSSLATSGTPSTASELRALAVYLDYPYPGLPGVNYTRDPITITGYVNHADARVKVNGVEAQVNPDGNYSASIQFKEGSNAIQAVASLGEQVDEITYLVGVTKEGKLYPIPGLGGGGPRYQSRVTYDQDIELIAGETTEIPVILDMRKDFRDVRTVNLLLSFTSGEYGEDNLPPPQGLEATVEPPRLRVFPNTTYESAIILITARQLTPGTYWLRFEQKFQESQWSRGWIKINVLN